jgi:peptide/nickel transport system ATP-binding protein
MALLQIKDLTLSHGQRRLVDGLNLSVNEGEILALAGESGSGKSLTALSVLGLAPPGLEVKGQILLEGQDLLTVPTLALRHIRGGAIGMVFQEPMTALNPLMRIGDQIAEGLILHRGASASEARAGVLQMMARVGLLSSGVTADRYPHQMSGGQRQRAAIAMALAPSPRLILVDEPTTALDVTTEASVVELMTRLVREDGAGLIFITHDLALAAGMADRIAILQNGVKLEDAPPDRLFAHLAHPYSRALAAAARPQHFSPRPPPGRDKPVLSATNLVRTYPRHGRSMGIGAGGVRAVDGVSLDIFRGEIVALVGASGSGKSSLARTLLALEPAQSGQVQLMGERFSTTRGPALRRLRTHIQAVFQDPVGSLDPIWTVAQIVAEPLALIRPRLSPADVQARVREGLIEVGLEPEHAHRRPHEFSGGQRQRIAIARALAAEPSVLVLDEATSALDVTTRAQILRLIHDLAGRRGLAVLLVSHDLASVRTLADRVLVMEAGKIVEQGPTDQVFSHPAHPVTQALIAAAPDLDRALERRRLANSLRQE